MNSKTKKALIATGVVFLLLLIDQLSKIWVKTNMYIGQDIPVFGNWFLISFIENPGMAFGINPGNILILFRMALACFIIAIIVRLIKQDYKTGFIVCFSLILAGGIGNIIDNIFYGMIFEESTPWHVASFVPWGQGYAALFQGKVVDMLSFPIIRTTYPEWFPFLGGNDFIFFRYVFNVADSAITIGVALLLIFYRDTLYYLLLSKKEREKLEREKLEKQNA